METTILKHVIPSMGEASDIQKALTDFGQSLHNVISVDSSSEITAICQDGKLPSKVFPLFFWDTSQDALFIVRTKTSHPERLAGRMPLWKSSIDYVEGHVPLAGYASRALAFSSPDSNLVTAGWELSSDARYLTVPEAGVYTLSAYALKGGNGEAQWYQLTATMDGQYFSSQTSGNGQMMLSVTQYMPAGSRIELGVYFATGYAWWVDSGRVTIAKIA